MSSSLTRALFDLQVPITSVICMLQLSGNSNCNVCGDLLETGLT